MAAPVENQYQSGYERAEGRGEGLPIYPKGAKKFNTSYYL